MCHHEKTNWWNEAQSRQYAQVFTYYTACTPQIEVRVVQHTLFLLQRDKLVSTNTGAAVACGLVSHGELGKVVADHFSLNIKSEEAKASKTHRTNKYNKIQSNDKYYWQMLWIGINLDLDVDEELAVVDTHDRADHFGDNGHVSQVRLDSGGLVEGSGSLLSLAQLLEQRVVSTGDAACETTTNAASQKLQKLLLALVQQSLELNATEAEGGGGNENLQEREQGGRRQNNINIQRLQSTMKPTHMHLTMMAREDRQSNFKPNTARTGQTTGWALIEASAQRKKKKNKTCTLATAQQ
jgi:hypothetical protein